jgi:hypothetical protein
MTTAHHPLGPSSLYRRQQCPGSLRMEDGLPETSDTTGIRDLGSNLHPAVPNKELRADMEISHIRQLEICDAALAQYGGWEWHFEKRLHIKEPFTDREVLFGTADFYALEPCGDRAALIDFKFGYTPVHTPAENLQLAAYALAIMQAHPEIVEVDAMIVQPTILECDHPVWTFTDPDGLYKTITRIEAACRHDAWVLQAGDHCRYCRAKGQCPAFQAATAPVLARQTLPVITPENAADLLRKAKLAGQMIDELKDRIKQAVVDNGGKLGDLSIIAQGGNRYIPDLVRTYTQLREFFTANEFMALCDLSPTALEKALAPKLVEQGKAETMAAAKRMIGDMVEMRRGNGKQVLKIGGDE